ncbi:MAG: hypothetical protein WD825_13375 [Gemmatimonadaceae bacterium]
MMAQASFRVARTLCATSTVMLGALVGCAPPAVAPPAPQPVFFLLAIPASVDSAIVLARSALREINGSLQTPRFANGVTSVTTHYVRTRQDGGDTRVAVVLEVSHKIVDPSVTITAVRLSAWALDYAGDFLNRPSNPPPNRRSPSPSAAAISSQTAPLNSRPRGITDSDEYDLQELLHVLEALMKYGARRMP